MDLINAISCCHVRSAIFRKSKPSIKYWKNHQVDIIDRVPIEDQMADDWEEYDPRENDDSSLFMFND